MSDFKQFVYSPAASVEEKLNVFLDYLKALMLAIVEEKESSYQNSLTDYTLGEYWSRVIDNKVLDSIRTAWPDIERRIEKLRSNLKEMTNESSERHGLSGPELNLKLDALGWASRELASATRVTSNTAIGPRKSKRIVGIVKKNFELGELVIGSILEATKAGTALKEIMKLFGHVFKDFNKR